MQCSPVDKSSKKLGTYIEFLLFLGFQDLIANATNSLVIEILIFNHLYILVRVVSCIVLELNYLALIVNT